MTFVVSAWYLTIFFFVVSLLFFFLSFRWEKPTKQSVFRVKELLFMIGIVYVALAHFSMYVSIGQALDENYRAPCENVVNSSTYVSDSFTTYTYVDSCASITAPEPSSSLVVIYTWLLFAAGIGVFCTVMIGLISLARKYV